MRSLRQQYYRRHNKQLAKGGPEIFGVPDTLFFLPYSLAKSLSLYETKDSRKN